jgi:tRNA(adenine34) deaminase
MIRATLRSTVVLWMHSYWRTVMDDVAAMRAALVEARQAAKHGDVPVGAIVVCNGAVIASARAAAAHLGTWRLDDCTLYVTLEPCVMCAGAIINARVGTVVFGAPDLKAGAVGSLYNIAADPRLNHEPVVRHGVLAEECASLLHEFFSERR